MNALMLTVPPNHAPITPLGPQFGLRTSGLSSHKAPLSVLSPYRDVPLESIAEAIVVPLGTLKDWLRAGIELRAPHADDESPPDPRGPQLETVLAEWARWDGSFASFCDHVQLHCRVPFGRTLIGRILEAHGVRVRRRRPGRSPDELALRGSFLTFFPHAQWVGDGGQVPIEIDGVRFVFNVELNVDAYTGAFVGAAIGLVEDGAAVIDAFEDAEQSTGARPLALLLDNKPSNHTAEVRGALGDTLLIRATPFRPQNKGHVEGGLGLLKPTLDDLVLDARGGPACLAQAYLRSLVITWSRTINHRPRPDRGGRSRVDLLHDQPSDEEVEQARTALRERLERQNKARQTRAARQDPVVRATLDDAYRRLGLDDPDGNILTATARYPLDAVVEAIAIFEGRHRAGTLPERADARYLLGIARNIAEEREGWEIALALWDARVAAADLLAEELGRQLDKVTDHLDEPEDLVKAYVDRALKTHSRLERFFWLTSAADAVTDEDDDRHNALFRLAARRIHSTHAVPHRDRLAATRFLAAKVVPLR